MDIYGEVAEYYKDVPTILSKLKESDVKVAVMAYTRDPIGCRNFFKLLAWDKYIAYEELNMKSTVRQLER